MFSLGSVLVALFVFVVAYGIVITTTSVGYHRGLAHGAVTIRSPFRSLLINAGMWLTGIDPKTWVVLHRLHHAHSDTKDDPHSPRNLGGRGGATRRFFAMFKQQLVGYDSVAKRLRAGDPLVTSMGKDLGELSWPMRTTARSFLPLLVHGALALAVVAFGAGWLVGAALFAGMMSHLVQGAIINYFGHAHGTRNFEIEDDSRNHHGAAWVALGEGFQNNHHRYPSSARFSFQRSEVDLGYAVSLVLERLRVIEVRRDLLMPRKGLGPVFVPAGTPSL